MKAAFSQTALDIIYGSLAGEMATGQVELAILEAAAVGIVAGAHAIKQNK